MSGPEEVPDAPMTDADMVITIRLKRVGDDVRLNRSVDILSPELIAVEDAMTEADHAAVVALLQMYCEAFVGLFVALGDMKLLRELMGERVS